MESLAQQAHAILYAALGRSDDGHDNGDQGAATEPPAASTDPFDNAPFATGSDRDAYVRRAAYGAGYAGAQAEAFAARVQGDTRAEIDADVVALVELYGAPPVRVTATDPSQGHGTGSDPVVESNDARFRRFLNENLSNNSFRF